MTKQPVAPILTETQPRESVNIRFQLVFAADNTPIRCPGFIVAPGLTVTLKGVNGVTANAHNAFVGETPEELATTAAQVVLPAADVQVNYPVDNLAEIWCMGKAGDGLLITVTGASVG